MAEEQPPKQYEYGLTPEMEGEGLASLFTKAVGALTPARREVLRAPETRFVDVDGAGVKDVTPGEYGEPEFGMRHMPARRALGQGLDYFKNLLTNPETRAATRQALGGIPGALWEQQTRGAEAWTQGYPSGYDPETGEEYTFDPLLVPALAAPAGILLRPSGAFVGMFAGMKSPMADLDALNAAKTMAKAGTDRKEIWQTTGWWNDKGHWKFEISDEAARSRDASLMEGMSGALVKKVMSDPKELANWLKSLPKKSDGSGYTVADVLEHPELMKTYPPVKGFDYQKRSWSGFSSVYEKRLRTDQKKLAVLEKARSSPDELSKFMENQGWNAYQLDETIESLKFNIASTQKKIQEMKAQPAYGGIGEARVTSGGLESSTLGQYDILDDAIGLSTTLRKAAPELTPEIRAKLERYKELGSMGIFDENPWWISKGIPTKKIIEFQNEHQRLEKEVGPWLDRKPPGHDDYTQVLLHEIQHAIQSREDWAMGGSESIVKKGKLRKFYLKEFDKLLSEQKDLDLEPWFHELKTPARVRKNLLNTSKDLYTEYADKAANRVYYRLAGEAEARNVEFRRNMTNEERRRIPPWETLKEVSKVPEEELIVHKKAGGGFVDKPFYDRAV